MTLVLRAPADTPSQVKIAIYGSLAANCVLACLQLYAAVSSLSLSFFATCIDSVFDPAANLVLNWCHRAGQRADLRRYPSGGSRFETVGDIVYSVSMLAVSLILVAFSIQDLARGTADKELHVSPWCQKAKHDAHYTILCCRFPLLLL